jgi:hypothetical protein
LLTRLPIAMDVANDVVSSVLHMDLLCLSCHCLDFVQKKVPFSDHMLSFSFLLTPELGSPGFILFVYGEVARRIWSWCNILQRMLPFSPPS